jgi:hypothetical protein
MKTVNVYSLFGFNYSEMTNKERTAFWALFGLFTLSITAIAAAYVFSVIGTASGENIPFV